MLLTYHPAFIPVLTGLFAHAAFRRFEPRAPSAILSLLLVPPLLISVALYNEGHHLLAFCCLPLHIAALVISTVLYRLSPLHPLAKYPGPLLFRVTRLWGSKLAAGGDQHRYYHSLHERYGPIVRTGPNHLHIRESKAIKIVMGQSFRRGGHYEANRMPGSEGPLIGIIDPPAHSQRRRIWDRAFTPSSVKEYEHFVAERLSQLDVALSRAQGKVTDLARWLNFFSFDVMGDVAYGSLFNLLKAGEDEEGYIANIHKSVVASLVIGTIEWIKPFLMWLPAVTAARQRFIAQGKRALDMRRQRGSVTKDLFYYLLDEEVARVHAPLNEATLVDEAGLSIIAGSDTTGTAMSNFFYYLLTHPVVYARLQAEVDAAGEDINDAAKLAAFSYLNAVINETLRLQPALPNGVQRRRPFGMEGVNVAGYAIPAGTTVQISMYSLHRDPRYFSPRPEAFEPERWIADSAITKEAGFKLDKEAYIPWSWGSTNCAGKPLAQLEMRMAVAALMRRFNFTLAESSESGGWTRTSWDRELRDGFVLLKGQLPVVVRLRE